MQPRVVVVGPLITASATKIAASQSVPAAQGVALTGASGTVVANNIAASQTLAGAGAVVLVAGIAPTSAGAFGGGLPYATVLGQRRDAAIYITSAGNDSGITFTILGRGPTGNVQSEVVTGANTSVAASRNTYSALYSIKASGATASTITIGTFLPVTLDAAREVIFTSGGSDVGITFTISGLDITGNSISEVLTGANGVATSALSYYVILSILASGATASTLTVGTNTVARSPWVRLDDWAMSQIAIQCTVSGTVNYTIQQTLDDPNSIGNPVAPSAVTWVNTNDTAGVAATGTIQSNYSYPPTWASILLNSGTGSVTASYVQPLAVPQ